VVYGFAGLVVCVVAAGTFLTPPTYRSTATLWMEGDDPRFERLRLQALARKEAPRGAAMASGPAGGPAAPDPPTAVHVLPPSPSPARDRGRLARNYLGAIRSGPILEALLERTDLGQSEELDGLDQDEAIAALRRRVCVSRERGTDLVRIGFDARDPDRAAAALAELLELFVDRCEARQPDRARDVEALDAEEARLRSELDAAAERVRELEDQQGSFLLETELRRAHRALEATEREALAAEREEARLLDRQSQVKRASERGESPAVRLRLLGDEESIETLHALRDERARLEHELARLLARSGYRAADREALRARIGEVDARIEGLLEMAAALLAARIREVRGRSAALAARLGARRAEVSGLRDRLDRLERARHTRDRLAQRLDDLRRCRADLWLAAASDPTGLRIEVMDPPSFPVTPHRPRPVRDIGLAALAGVVGGMVLALLLELLDDRIKGNRDLREALGLPSLGSIPRLAGRHASDRMKLITVEQPRSRISEAFRGICSGIAAQERGSPGARARKPNGKAAQRAGRRDRASAADLAARHRDHVILVTSAGRGEGKTTTASNLAVSLAQAGYKTLLVDANLRDPRVHQTFHVTNERGLSSLVAAGEPLERCVRGSGVPNLSVLPSGPTPVNPSEVFLGAEFESALADLRRRFDRIVIDAPAISVGHDVVVLGRLADNTLMVVGAYQTSREEAAARKEYLTGLGIRVGGAILNRHRATGDEAVPELVPPPPDAEAPV